MGLFGGIIDVQNGGGSFEAGVFDDEGETVTVATVTPGQIRLATEQDLAARLTANL